MKSLVFHQAALGDWVLTFPLLRALNAAGHDVIAVTPADKGRLAASVLPNVTPIDIEQHDFTRLHSPDGHRETSDRIRQHLHDATHIVSFVSDGRDAWAQNVRTLVPGASHCFVQPRPPDTWSQHVTDWHRRQLSDQGIALPIVDAPASPPGNECVLIHPGSGGAHKCWPDEKWEHLLSQLEADRIATRIVLGEVEIERWSADRLARWRDRYEIVTCDDLEQLRREVVDGACFVGNDAGPTHLAAQMGRATVAIFNPTDPRIWRPIGPDVNVIAPSQPGAGWPRVQTVLFAIRMALRR